MKTLKIGVLTEIISSHSGSRAPVEIARHLAKLGHNVTLYAYSFSKDPKLAQSLTKDGVKIVTIQKPDIPLFGKYIASITLFKILKKDSPQIMTFSGTPPFFFTGKFTGIPIVRIYQGTQMDAYFERKLPNQKINFFEKLINKTANIYIYLVDFVSFRLSNGVVAISQYCAQEGESFYKRKVDAVIYHGTTLLKPKQNSKKTKKQIDVISVSRITPYKGFDKIIEALKQVRTNYKVVFTIAGSQPKKNYLRYLKKIGGSSLRIIIDPQDPELASLYKTSDIYTSADRYLYFGLPIMEAAKFAIPAVSLDLAAAKELVDHQKTGFIAKNQKEFTFFLEKLINNPSLRKKMGLAAKEKSKKISWEITAQKYVKVFRTLL